MYFLNLSTFSSSNNLGTLSNLISLNNRTLLFFGSLVPVFLPTIKKEKGMIANKSKKQEPFK
jgi:hypothetical protein